MRKVQRDQMGAYLCIASNDVPPAVSKRVILNVNCKQIIHCRAYYISHLTLERMIYIRIVYYYRLDNSGLQLRKVKLKLCIQVKVVVCYSAMIIMSLQRGYK